MNIQSSKLRPRGLEKLSKPQEKELYKYHLYFFRQLQPFILFNKRSKPAVPTIYIYFWQHFGQRYMIFDSVNMVPYISLSCKRRKLLSFFPVEKAQIIQSHKFRDRLFHFYTLNIYLFSTKKEIIQRPCRLGIIKISQINTSIRRRESRYSLRLVHYWAHSL